MILTSISAKLQGFPVVDARYFVNTGRKSMKVGDHADVWAFNFVCGHGKIGVKQ